LRCQHIPARFFFFQKIGVVEHINPCAQKILKKAVFFSLASWRQAVFTFIKGKGLCKKISGQNQSGFSMIK
jgi:hypothetical protein